MESVFRLILLFVPVGSQQLGVVQPDVLHPLGILFWKSVFYLRSGCQVCIGRANLESIYNPISRTQNVDATMIFDFFMGLLCTTNDYLLLWNLEE